MNMLKSISSAANTNGTVPKDTVAIVDGAADAQKKKRKKRSKKKKVVVRNDSDDSSDDEENEEIAAPVVKASALARQTSLGDPVEGIVDEVLKKCVSYGYRTYSRQKISDCVQAMWNSGLQYDSPDKVLAKLTAQENEEEEEEEYGDMSEANSADVTHSTQPSKEMARSGNTSTESLVAHTAQNMKSEDSAVPVTLAGRLEIAAEHSNMEETLTALTAWVEMQNGNTNEGKESLQEFFESHVLEIIFRRTLIEGNTTSNTSLSALLTAVVNQIPSCVENGTNESVDLTVLAITNFLTDLHTYLKTSLPVIITKNTNVGVDKKMHSSFSVLAKRVSTSVRALYVLGKAKQIEIERTNAESVRADVPLAAQMLQKSLKLIDSQVSELNHAEELLNVNQKLVDESAKERVHMQKLFSLREISLDKVQLLLESLEEILSPSDKYKQRELDRLKSVALNSNKSDPASNSLLESIVIGEAGETGNTLKLKREQGQSVVLVMEKLKSETDNKINPMNNEIEKCATKLSDLANIRVKLAQQLKATDAEIVAVENRKKTLTQSVNETVVTYERMLTKIGENPANREALAATRVIDGVKTVITKICELEETVSTLFLNAQKTETTNTTKKVSTITNQQRLALTSDHPARVANATIALQLYVRTESQCLSILTARVSKQQSQLVHLKREFAAYKSLNMTALANDVEENVKKVEENIKEDKNSISHLQENLVQAIERFKICFNLSDASLLLKLPTLEISQAAESLKQVNLTVAPSLLLYSPPPTLLTNGAKNSIDSFFPTEGNTFTSDTTSESMLKHHREEVKTVVTAQEKTEKIEKNEVKKSVQNSAAPSPKNEKNGKDGKDIKEKVKEIEKAKEVAVVKEVAVAAVKPPLAPPSTPAWGGWGVTQKTVAVSPRAIEVAHTARPVHRTANGTQSVPVTPAKTVLVVEEKKEIVETKVEKVAEVINGKEAEVKEKEVVVEEEAKHVKVKLDEKKKEETPEETKIVTKEVEKEVEDEDEDMVGVEGRHEEEIAVTKEEKNEVEKKVEVIASNIETSIEVDDDDEEEEVDEEDEIEIKKVEKDDEEEEEEDEDEKEEEEEEVEVEEEIEEDEDKE